MQTFCADESIDEIISRYKSTVYGIALARSIDPVDADDIFQEVFIAYFKRNRRFSSEEHRKAWIIRTTVNLCLKAHRARREIPSESLPQRAFTFALPEENELWSALHEIPFKYRIVLTLYYFDGLGCEEIAHALRITPGGVRMRLTRARELMREKLKGDMFDE
ncbi:MAG: sigma-70 family RNA polymerase sigma factor [Clostridia bacterium]|nr:sigma-70 family RNA polymerase sigma factor [Clostridia bacterium]